MGDGAFEGTLYYAAIYGVALSEAEVVGNAALLQNTDDGTR